MRQHLATWAVHDLDHVAQIYAGLAGSHEAERRPVEGVPRDPDAKGRDVTVEQLFDGRLATC